MVYLYSKCTDCRINYRRRGRWLRVARQIFQPMHQFPFALYQLFVFNKEIRKVEIMYKGVKYSPYKRHMYSGPYCVFDQSRITSRRDQSRTTSRRDLSCTPAEAPVRSLVVVSGDTRSLSYLWQTHMIRISLVKNLLAEIRSHKFISAF